MLHISTLTLEHMDASALVGRVIMLVREANPLIGSKLLNVNGGFLSGREPSA